MQIFRAIIGRAIIDVPATSKRRALLKLKRDYGIYNCEVTQINYFKYSTKHIAFAIMHEKAMGVTND